MLPIWLKFKGYIIAAVAALAFVATIFLKGKAAGRQQAETKQREVDDAARKRVDAVKPADSATTIERLRKGKF